jgi:hypothetical protein
MNNKKTYYFEEMWSKFTYLDIVHIFEAKEIQDLKRYELIIN